MMFGAQAKDKHIVNKVNVIVYDKEDLAKRPFKALASQLRFWNLKMTIFASRNSQSITKGDNSWSNPTYQLDE